MSKRFLSLAALLLIFCSPAFAQFTTVTATVQDSNGIPYAGAVMNAILVPSTGGGYTLNGQPYSGRIGPVTLSSNGSFTVNFGDVTLITPGSPQWQITIDSAAASIGLPLGTGPQSFTYTSTGTTISGGSPVSLTTALNALAPKLTNFASTGSVTSVTGTSPLSSSGGTTPTISCPTCAVGASSQVVQSGLLAEYRMLATESPCALVDYSGNGNNATGCVGTSPTIIPVTGGVNFSVNGAIGIPASLNSALTIQLFMSGAAGTFGSPIAGNGAGANSVGLMFAATPQGSLDTLLSMDRLFSANMSGTTKAYPRAAVPGNVVITWTLDTTDHLFINNLEPFYYFLPGASAGVQTVGNFQIGGNNGNHYGQNPSYLQGKIYYVVLYSRVLTSAEIASNVQFINNAMAARGLTPSLISTVASPANGATPLLVADGDSITEGAGFGVAVPYPGILTLTPASTGNISNMGLQGTTMSQLLLNAGVTVDPFYQPTATATDVIWAGTNSILGGVSAALTESQLASYCRARHAIGFKCVVVTMVSRTGFDTGKNAYNTLIRQHWIEFADALADVAADPSLGADGASANTIYIQTGGVHPTQNSHYNDITPVIQRAINRLYGNKDFSSASVYGSPAAAAASTTALTETTNTVTVTFSATPANCQVGNPIVIAGVTPSGYNSTTTNGAGNGAWTILTRSATQITFFSSTTGLGNATIQGLASCPQQQDVDQYQTLNFGTGNYTLQSCVGLTGQNIYIQNINASSSTLIPFGSETITQGGASPTTLAANTTAILQSQLVSASAAGCNWVRIQ
jgi:hypothetical protein